MELKTIEKEHLEDMITSPGWKVFMSILLEEKEAKKNLVLKYISEWKNEEAQKEALKIQYIDFLIEKPKNLLKKEKLKKSEWKKSDYDEYEESIMEWLAEND